MFYFFVKWHSVLFAKYNMCKTYGITHAMLRHDQGIKQIVYDKHIQEDLMPTFDWLNSRRDRDYF